MVFPVFIPIEGRSILLVGAGNVASGKADKLICFKPNLKVVALSVLPQFEEWAQKGYLKLEKRAFRTEDLDDVELVIVAADNLNLQAEIFAECQKRRILCNSVDSPDYCSFIFPALVARKNFVIGVSTGGKAPYITSKIRSFLERVLPQELDSWIEKVDHFRKSAEVKSLPNAQSRGEKVKAFAKSLMSKWSD